jgi:peptidyl-prolyl cis-trans isomerase-like 4
MKVPSRSPSPIVIRKNQGKIGESFDIDDRLEDDIDINAMMSGKTDEQLKEEIKEHEAKTRAAVLTILDDLPDEDIEPPKTVLFVCKLNPVTQEHDLELNFF